MQIQLKQTEKLVGNLYLEEIDQPWFHWKFEPGDVFKELKQFFNKELMLLNEEKFEEWEEINKEIKNLNLCLYDMTNKTKIVEYILHIEDDRAWFRY